MDEYLQTDELWRKVSSAIKSGNRAKVEQYVQVLEPLAEYYGHNSLYWIKGYNDVDIPGISHISRSANVWTLIYYLTGLINGGSAGLLKAIGIYEEYAKHNPNKHDLKLVLSNMIEAATFSGYYTVFKNSMSNIHRIFRVYGLSEDLDRMIAAADTQNEDMHEHHV